MKVAIRAAALALFFLPGAPVESRPRPAEVLYNGITLPTLWPPALTAVPADPVTPSYLVAPPAVIPIDVGRQLFVDDFLVESTTLQRTYHAAQYVAGNPMMAPDKTWEGGADPCAMPFSDGVWYDAEAKLYKMWYMGGIARSTCYATSTDGLAWTKPTLDIQAGTNIVHPGFRDSTTVWMDLEEKDPQRRYKMFRSMKGGSVLVGSFGLATHFSPDGLHWSEPPLLTGSCGDRSTVFYNPFRKVWVYSLRHGWGLPRKRRYWETADLVNGPKWVNIDQPPYWCGADSADLRRPELNVPPELYNLDCVAYESILLGLFTIWRGQPADRPKINEVVLGYSRDGWSWHRPERRAFIGVSEQPGAWNWGNVQSSIPGCLIVGDSLYFYVSGRAGVPGLPNNGVCSVGLATLRRDGFASMNGAAAGGTLTTRPLRFAGKRLFVNVNNPAGALRVEVLDASGQPIVPFAAVNCVPVAADSTRHAVAWTGAADLSAVAGRDVRLRFHLSEGSLYSFWVAPDAAGASRGYVAGGGPGLFGPTDTAGGSSTSGGAGTPPPPAAPVSPAAPLGPRDNPNGEGPCAASTVPLGPASALALALAALALAVTARPSSRNKDARR